MQQPGKAANDVVEGVNTADRVALVAMFAAGILISVMFTVTHPLAKPQAIAGTSTFAGSSIAASCPTTPVAKTRGG